MVQSPSKTRSQERPEVGDSPKRPSFLGRAIRRSWRMVLYGSLLCVLLLIVLIVTPLTDRLYLWLTVTQPPEKADVILCLGGRTERLFWAAELYHEGYAPTVIFTGHEDHADRMGEWLRMCGVPDEALLVDRTSATTGDHPSCVDALPGIDPKTMRFLIVTNHSHSRRVKAIFEQGGYDDFLIYGGPPPFSYEIDRSKRWRWRVLYLPYIAYECAALVQYTLQGRI